MGKKGSKRNQSKKSGGAGRGGQQGKKSYSALDDDDDNHQQNSSNNRKKKGNKSKGGGTQNRDDYALRQSIVGESGKRSIADMVSDGNCLFRSLSDQLYHDYGNKHDTVRNDICNFLQENEEEFAIFLLLEDENGNDEDVREFDSYVSEMRELGTWGGDVEIACAARLYRRRITVFSAVGAYQIGIGGDDENEIPSGPDLQISYHENSHYNSVHDEAIERSVKNRYVKPQPVILGQKKARVHCLNNTNVETEKKPKSKEKKIDERTIEDSKSVEESQQNDATNENDQQSRNKQEQQQRKGAHGKRQQRRNDLCSCGSGLRYKKCCLEKEKSRIRLEKWKEKHGLDENASDVNTTHTNESSVDSERPQLEGGFAVLRI